MKTETTWIALLRGVNVGGKKIVPMADLRAMVESLGLGDPRTLLQSGNVCFRSRGGDRRQIAAALESATRKRFGFEVTYVLRSATEWRAIVAANPFPAEAASDPGRLLMFALTAAPDGAAIAALEANVPGDERLRVIGAELYAHYPSGIGTSKLDNARIDRHLQVVSTGRNWNTVLKLATLSRENAS